MIANRRPNPTHARSTPQMSLAVVCLASRLAEDKAKSGTRRALPAVPKENRNRVT
jgi:hypothetical protein